MNNKCALFNIFQGLSEKERKGLQLLLRIIKNHKVEHYSTAFHRISSKDSLYNVLWVIEGHKTCYEDDLFQTLLRNYKHHHVSVGVQFCSTSNTDYQMYSKILAKNTK